MLRAIQIRPAAEAGAVAPDAGRLDRLAAALARAYSVNTHVQPATLDATFARDLVRKQLYSSAVLAKLDGETLEPGTVVLGVTESDLYVPVLTFVFGEAQLAGRCAVVSAHRLREEFYGLPPDDVKLEGRLLKESMHEIGHTQGLRHCDDWRCVMSSSHAVEKLDLKQAAYCKQCLGAISRNNA